VKKIIFVLITSVILLSACIKNYDAVPVSNFPPEEIPKAIYIETTLETAKNITEESTENTTAEPVTTTEDISETEQVIIKKQISPPEPVTEPLTIPAPIPEPVPEPIQKFMFTVMNSDFTPSEYLINDINEIIKNDTFRTGFYLKSLDGNIEMGHNITEKYSYDSTIKTAVALYLYKEVAENRIDLNEYINDETIGGLISRMLITSDSDAYLILRNHFGKEKINALTKSLGCKTFTIINDWGTETPVDAGILWEGVYKFCNDDRSGEIGKLFMNQLLTSHWNFIGDILPQYSVAHKYGQTNSVFAQNCFIFKEVGNSYIFTYYTSGGREPNNLSQVVTTLDEIMKEYDLYLENQ